MLVARMGLSLTQCGLIASSFDHISNSKNSIYVGTELGGVDWPVSAHQLIKGRKDKSYDLIREKMQLINFSDVRKLEYAHLIWSLRKIV